MRKMVRGEGKAGCVFYALLAAIVGLLAFRIVPHQVSKLELKDYMKQMAMTAPKEKQNRWFEDRIRDRAKELNIPITGPEQVRVKKSPRRIIMDVEYTVVLDLVVTEYAMKEKIHMDRELFNF